jgi:predicted DNA-binding antitoxin AbrB/MazE fold protein
MTKTLSAVYENGVLRPSEPLPLKESQRVTVTISDSLSDLAEAWLDNDYMGAVDTMDETEPALEEVRLALSKISGTFSDAVRTERDAQG